MRYNIFQWIRFLWKYGSKVNWLIVWETDLFEKQKVKYIAFTDIDMINFHCHSVHNAE